MGEEEHVPVGKKCIIGAPEEHIHDGKNTVEPAVLRTYTEREADRCYKCDKGLPHGCIKEEHIKLGNCVAQRVNSDKPCGDFIALCLDKRVNERGNRADTASDTACV